MNHQAHVLSVIPPAQLRSDLEAESAERAKRLAAQIAQQREERLRQEVHKPSVFTLYKEDSKL